MVICRTMVVTNIALSRGIAGHNFDQVSRLAGCADAATFIPGSTVLPASIGSVESLISTTSPVFDATVSAYEASSQQIATRER